MLPVGLLGSTLVAVGGSLHARLALTPQARVVAGLDEVRSLRPAGFALAFSGLTLLTVAWLLLGSQVRGHRDGVGRVLRAVAWWVLPLLVAPPLFSNDAWSYVAEGDLVAQDKSPYIYTPLDLSGPLVHAIGALWVDVPAPYGPLPLMWGGLVASVSTDPWWGLLGFRVVALAGLVCLAWSVSRLARRTGRDPAVATWLAAASPFTLVHGIGGAHLDLSIAGLLALAVLWSLRGWWLAGAVLVGAATAIKAPAVVADVAVVLASVTQTASGQASMRDRARRASLVVGVSAATVLGLGLVSGLGTGWLSGLSTPLRHRSPLSPTTEVAVHLGRLVGVSLLTPVHLLAVSLLALVVGWVGLRAPARNAADVVRAAAIVMSATLLLSPVVHYWYYFWCLPFLASAALSLRARRGVLGMTLVLGLIAPADYSAGHLSFSSTLVLVGVGAAAASFFLPRGPGRRREASSSGAAP